MSYDLLKIRNFLSDHFISISDILANSNIVALSFQMFSCRQMGRGMGKERLFKINLDVCVHVYVHPTDDAAVNYLVKYILSVHCPFSTQKHLVVPVCLLLHLLKD